MFFYIQLAMANCQFYTCVCVSGRDIRTHGDGVDFSRDLDDRVDATKDVDRVVQLSVFDFNRFVVLLVFL